MLWVIHPYYVSSSFALSYGRTKAWSCHKQLFRGKNQNNLVFFLAEGGRGAKLSLFFLSYLSYYIIPLIGRRYFKTKTKTEKLVILWGKKLIVG